MQRCGGTARVCDPWGDDERHQRVYQRRVTADLLRLETLGLAETPSDFKLTPGQTSSSHCLSVSRKLFGKRRSLVSAARGEHPHQAVARSYLARERREAQHTARSSCDPTVVSSHNGELALPAHDACTPCDVTSAAHQGRHVIVRGGLECRRHHCGCRQCGHSMYYSVAVCCEGLALCNPVLSRVTSPCTLKLHCVLFGCAHCPAIVLFDPAGRIRGRAAEPIHLGEWHVSVWVVYTLVSWELTIRPTGL